MGTIKDLVDLVTQLSTSIKDRKVAEELREVQNLALTLQSEQSSLHEANMLLREERLKFKEQIGDLEKKIEELSSPIERPSGVPACPNCSTLGKPFYMSPMGPQASWTLRAKLECTKCKYRI